MSTAQRRQPLAVIERLLAQPYRFDFVQAVRLLEQWFMQNEDEPGGDVVATRLLFRNSLSLAFPSSEIESLLLIDETPLEAGSQLRVPPRRVDITPAFMGLLGVAGTLPSHYTEQIARRELFDKDRAARAFLDIFQHRAVLLFFKAWRKSRLALQYEFDRNRHFTPQVLAFGGLGFKGLRNRLADTPGPVHDESLAYFSGLLQQRQMSAPHLARVLADYFSVPVKAEQFVGRWFDLPNDGVSRLGLSQARLGTDAVLGERVWQRDLRVRLTFGPLDKTRHKSFLPGGSAAAALKKLLTLLTGVSLEYEVSLRLKAEAIAPLQLATRSGASAALGFNTFLVSKPGQDDRQDVHYDIHAAA
ncbi:MAG: hypothetical protein RLZZ618_570 [Pseudomonadota bacterium]|jgi:type VI secretion system protein ImpH